MSYEDIFRQRMIAFSKGKDDPTKGRPISELIKTSDTLRGYESQRLRTYFTSICMEPSRDLDDFGRVIASGNLTMVQMNFLIRVGESLEKISAPAAPEAEAKAHIAAAKELYDLRWGPTKTPIYNLLGLMCMIIPSKRVEYLDIAQFLINTAKVPVDGVDLSGTTALSHCFSTKPAFDLEYAQMLYDAGGEVNHKNRYGSTVAQEIIQVWNPDDSETVRKAKAAFEWFLSHGGNADIDDTNGDAVRGTVETGRVRALKAILGKEDKRREARGSACCTLCGREDVKLLTCGRCKKVRYCQPGKRNCQKDHWPKHKLECKA